MPIDQRMESYQSFYDHSWAKQADALARHTPLEDPLFDVCVSWKEAANTARLPWLTAHSAESFAIGFASVQSPFTQRVLRDLRDTVVKACQLDLTREQRQKIASWFDQRHAATRRAVERESKVVLAETASKERFWSEVIQLPEWGLSIEGSQRLAFAAVYFAYEHFLYRSYVIKTGLTDYRIGQQFKQDFTAAFNEELCDECWTHSGVELGRLVRNALCHNGGRLTKYLENRKRELRIEDGQIQIWPEDVKKLFDLLKSRVYIMITACLK